jgi:hypothetical protein
MEVSNVVKVLMGRVCNNVLPTKANLLKRKIVANPLCPICGLDVETTGHALELSDGKRCIEHVVGSYKKVAWRRTLSMLWRIFIIN